MIGLRIREARQARGMTQATLAKGISSRTYIPL
jgi:transcriptional regulator with XRE-family HTH domain